MWALSSLPRRDLRKERKRERAGHDGKGKREERLPPFPSSHPSPRGFYFSIIFIGIPSGSLCGGELALSILSPPPPGLQYNAIILYLPTLHLGVIKNLLNHVYESKTIKKKRN